MRIFTTLLALAFCVNLANAALMPIVADASPEAVVAVAEIHQDACHEDGSLLAQGGAHTLHTSVAGHGCCPAALLTQSRTLSDPAPGAPIYAISCAQESRLEVLHAIFKPPRSFL